MRRRSRRALAGALAVLAALACVPLLAWGAPPPDIAFPGVEVRIGAAKGPEIATALKIVLALTALALAPAIVVAMTAFTRIIVVLALLRQALGLQDTPPNAVLISLALFLTLFAMLPVIERIDREAWQPLDGGKIAADEALRRGVAPLKEYMLGQTREQDLALMVEIARAEAPRAAADVSLAHLVPAYMLSELRAAFQIGFVIFLPFLLLDLIVASVLMSLGMLMVPPIVISLPLKIMLFVLIDGWNLVVRSLIGSLH
jgi:flagellar biosynthetic protein FliP